MRMPVSKFFTAARAILSIGIASTTAVSSLSTADADDFRTLSQKVSQGPVKVMVRKGAVLSFLDLQTNKPTGEMRLPKNTALLLTDTWRHMDGWTLLSNMAGSSQWNYDIYDLYFEEPGTGKRLVIERAGGYQAFGSKEPDFSMVSSTAAQ